MHPIRDVAHRHFSPGPAGKAMLKQMAAYLAMQAADAVDGATAAQGQVSHVERLLGVVWIGTAQRQQVLHTDSQGVLGIPPEPLFDESRSEPIETRFDGSMGGEEIAGARHCEGDV